MLLIGGGRLDAWQKGEAPEFRELYGFDPKTETIERLADGPDGQFPRAAELADDSKRGLFVMVADFQQEGTALRDVRLRSEEERLARDQAGQSDSAAPELDGLDEALLRRAR